MNDQKLKYKFMLLFVLPSLLLLTGCVSRDQADARLAKGCGAAVEVFLEDGMKINKIIKSRFGDSPDNGPGFREVTINVVETDSWYETEKDYHCIFAEEFTLFNLSHRASIYQVKVDDRVFGKQGDKILGTLNDHLKLTEAVDNAMR